MRRVIAVTRIDGENIGIVVNDVDVRSIALAPQEGCVELSLHLPCLSCFHHCSSVRNYNTKSYRCLFYKIWGIAKLCAGEELI